MWSALNTARGSLTTRSPLCSDPGLVNGRPAERISPSLRWEGWVSERQVRARPFRRRLPHPLPHQGGGVQEKGLMITSTTISTTAMPGSSFMILSALPLTGRAPRSSFLP